jgi:hypothetical protein
LRIIFLTGNNIYFILFYFIRICVKKDLLFIGQLTTGGMESRVKGLGRVGWPKWSGWSPPPNRRACTTRGRLSSCSLQSWSVAGAIAATMNKEKLMKMATAVRTGGKGSVRR